MRRPTRRRSSTALPALALLAATAWPGTAKPAVIEALSLAQLTAVADRVVVARVASSRAHRPADGRRIFTDTRLEVSETIKGDHAPTLVVRTAGGVVGEVGQRVQGAATFYPGEQVLLFLESHGLSAEQTPRYRVVALAYGKFSLGVDQGGRSIASRDLGQLAVIEPDSGAIRPLAAEAPVPTADLLRRIRRLVGAPRGTPRP